jgi:hypothetical protein
MLRQAMTSITTDDFISVEQFMLSEIDAPIGVVGADEESDETIDEEREETLDGVVETVVSDAPIVIEPPSRLPLVSMPCIGNTIVRDLSVMPPGRLEIPRLMAPTTVQDLPIPALAMEARRPVSSRSNRRCGHCGKTRAEGCDGSVRVEKCPEYDPSLSTSNKRAKLYESRK